MLSRLIKFSNRVHDHWIGDFIGCACLAAIFLTGMLFVGSFQ